MKLFLGDRYYPYTSAMSKLPMEKQDLENPTLEAYTEDGEDCMRVTVPTQVQSFKVVHQKEAIRAGGNRSANYRLSERLQVWIRDKSVLPHLDFSAPRFHGLGHVVLNPEEQEGDMHIAGEYQYEPAAAVEIPASGQKRKATDALTS